MSRYESYCRYREKHQNIEPTELVYELDQIKILISAAEKLNMQTKDTSGVYNWHYQGTYLAQDSRVFELWINNNGTNRAWIWKSLESYKNHKEALPFNIWAWG